MFSDAQIQNIIPNIQWLDSSLFNSQLSELQTRLMQTPTEELIKAIENVCLDSYVSKRCTLLAIVYSHRELSFELLEEIANKLELDQEAFFKCLMMLGDVKYFDAFTEKYSRQQLKELIFGDTSYAFRCAASYGHLALVDKMLAIFPDEEASLITTNGNYYIFDMCCQRDQIEAMQYVIDRVSRYRPAKVKTMILGGFQQALREGRINAMAYLFEIAPDLLQELPTNASLPYSMEAAAERGHLAAIEYLLNQFGEQRASWLKAHGENLLTHAAASGQLSIVSYLLTGCPEVLEAMAGNKRYAAVVEAAEKGHVVVFEYLLEHIPGIEKNLPRRGGVDAFRRAADKGYHAIAERLIQFPQIFSDVVQNFSNAQIFSNAADEDRYQQYLIPYVTQKVAEIRLMHQKDPASLCDVENQEQANYFLDMVRILIHCNKPALMDDVRFFLNIPRVKALLFERNSRSNLLHLALVRGNNDALDYLLEIPEIKKEVTSQIVLTEVAIRSGNLAVNRMLMISRVYEHFEKQDQFSDLINSFTDSQLAKLHERANQHNGSNSSEVFDIQNAEETELYFLILRNLIKRNVRRDGSDFAERIRFLLDIPSIKALMTKRDPVFSAMSLLQLALTNGDEDTSRQLLAIPEVRQLAEGSRSLLSLAQASGNISLVFSLLSLPLTYVNAVKDNQCSRFLEEFTKQKLGEIRTQKARWEEEIFTETFDIQDPAETNFCFHLLSYLIRHSDPIAEEEIRFLLAIPSVRVLVDKEMNGQELLDIATKRGEESSIKMLLEIPSVRQLAQRNIRTYVSRAESSQNSRVLNSFLALPLFYTYQEERSSVEEFTKNKLAELHERQTQKEQEDANAIFDITDPEEQQLCFYLIRNLIRNNNRALVTELRFLLNLPSIRALAHTAVTPYKPNELLLTAYEKVNQDAVDLLLSIPEVYRVAEEKQFYWREQIEWIIKRNDRSLEGHLVRRLENQYFKDYGQLYGTALLKVAIQSDNELAVQLLIHYLPSIEEGWQWSINLKQTSLPLINNLLVSAAIYAYVEERDEYSHLVEPFTTNYLTAIRSRKAQWEEQNSGVVFDIENTKEAKLCFSILRHLIRCNASTNNLEKIHFLLTIPRLRAELRGGSSQLLRLALIQGDEGAAKLLLAIPDVENMAFLFSDATFEHAVKGGNPALINYLLTFPAIFNNTEAKSQYSAYIEPFTATYLANIHEQKAQWEHHNPEAVFDVEEPEARFCRLILNNLIRRNQPELSDEIAFLLKIPRVSHLIIIAPDCRLLALKSHNESAFRQLLAIGDSPLSERDIANLLVSAQREGFEPIIDCLLTRPAIYAYAEQHTHEHGEQVERYTRNKLAELHDRQAQKEQEDANAIFDITDPEEQQLCFYLIRNLIRNHDPAHLEDIQFLLEIPSVRALVALEVTPNRPNELFLFALNTNNQAALRLLLTIPEVYQTAERHNFYQAQQQEGFDIRALARDRESSMNALTSGEQHRLEKAIQHYESRIKSAGVGFWMNKLRHTLAKRFNANPPQMTLADEESISLPVDWESFNELALPDNLRQIALEAYYKNADHTALRFISRPNKWIDQHALYIIRGNNNEKWADFEGYQFLIVTFWLAAWDENVAPIEGHTLEGRRNHFINELALLGRAHNWDATRQRVDQSGNSILEAYDDLRGDKPSCYSGMKRRLFQSVIGHPFFTVLTEQTVKEELRDFIREIWTQRLNDENRSQLKAYLTTYEIMLEMDDQAMTAFKALNIEEDQQVLFITYLEKKYDGQLDFGLKSFVWKEFALNSKSTDVHQFLHAFKFGVILRELLERPASKVGHHARAMFFGHLNVASTSGVSLAEDEQSEDATPSQSGPGRE